MPPPFFDLRPGRESIRFPLFSRYSAAFHRIGERFAHAVGALPGVVDRRRKSLEMFHRTVTALEAWLPDARRHTVNGASHGMNLAHPAAFNRYVDEFVRSL
jgi:pimeloyl-ACP methyl ester carboxylesterase